MKRLSLLVVLFVLGSVTMATAADFAAFSDVPEGIKANPAIQGPTLPPWTAMQTLIFWNDEILFNATYPGLTMEDFAATNVPPNGVEACDGPFNSATNNTCFSPGDIVAGLEVDNLAAPPNNMNVVLTPPFLSVTSVTVGPNTFDADAVIRFNPPVAAVGMDVVAPFGPFPVAVTVFGASGPLGNSSVTMGPASAFWGVSSDSDLITRLEFVAGTGNGELFQNIRFGAGGATPVESATWGQIKSTFEN